MFAVQAKGKHRSEDTGPQSAPGLPRWQDLDSANAAQKVIPNMGRFNSHRTSVSEMIFDRQKQKAYHACSKDETRMLY